MPGIVIEPSKVVYWPIPKNANTSFKIRFAELLGIPYDKSNHESIYQAPFVWTDLPIPGYRDIAFVRNPGQRLYSLYINKILQNEMMIFDPYGKLFWQTMSFESFVSSIISIDRTRADPHFAPQIGQIPLGCITYKLEDMAGLLYLFLGKYNSSEYQIDWHQAYNAELWYKMVNYYKDDFKTFNYNAVY